MKKITNIDSYIRDHASQVEETTRDFHIEGMLSGHFVLPNDDPVNGHFGCTISLDNDKELIYSSQIFEPSVHLHCKSFDEFLVSLRESLDNNFPTFYMDDPILQRLGFLSLRNTDNLWFTTECRLCPACQGLGELRDRPTNRDIVDGREGYYRTCERCKGKGVEPSTITDKLPANEKVKGNGHG